MRRAGFFILQPAGYLSIVDQQVQPSIGDIQQNLIAGAHGRKRGLGFEITGTKGALRFDQERMNELAVYEARGAAGRRGFRSILSGPEHPYYAAFCPAPGHGLGFNDLKLIEVYRLLSGLDGAAPLYPDFRDAAKIARVIDAVLRAAGERHWVAVAEV